MASASNPLRGRYVVANHRAVDNYNYIHPKNEISYKNLKTICLTETQTPRAELAKTRKRYSK